jgi:MSHA biogenesis protein MshL
VKAITSATTMTTAILLSAGCATHKAAHDRAPLQVSVSQEKPKPLEPLPDAPVRAEGEKRSPEEFRRPGRRYTLFLAGADAREFFLSLAKENDLNLVLSPEVSGSVTLDVKEATAREVIEEACRLLACRVEVAGRIVRVGPEQRETHFFQIDYLLTTRVGQGSLTASTTTGGGSSPASSAGSAGSSSGSGESSSSNSVLTEEKVDFFGSLLEEVRSLLSGADAKAVLNRATGTLSITDYPRNLEKVSAYLRVLDERARTGVIIEARILEVTLDDATKYGIDWSALPNMGWLGLSGALGGGAVMSQTLPSGLDSGFKFGVTGSHFNGFLDALATNGQLNVLSAPKVATLNNQKAIIRIGRQDVFFRATVTPATATTAAVVTYNPDTITEGIILSVTPQVSRDGHVMLAIHPTITERVGTATAPDKNTAPIIDVRETNTMVSVEDGQTVVIGGLMQERTQETVSSVPFFGDIPFIGALFRSVDQKKRKTELVILITPRVVPPASLAGMGGDDVKRLRSLEQGHHAGGRPWLYGTDAEAKTFRGW